MNLCATINKFDKCWCHYTKIDWGIIKITAYIDWENKLSDLDGDEVYGDTT